MALSHAPDHRVRVSNRCFINGFLFQTSDIEKNLTTQNSGVVVKGDGMEWYRMVKKIITLDFPNEKEVILFKCDWFDVPAGNVKKSRGYIKDQYGIIDIDMTRLRFLDEPYILATEQVCYVKSANKINWCSVHAMKPRNMFSMQEGEYNENNVGDVDVDSLVVGVENMNVAHQNEGLTNWSRTDLEGQTGDASVIEAARATSMHEPGDDDEIPDEDDSDDAYVDDRVVAPVEANGADDEDDFFV